MAKENKPMATEAYSTSKNEKILIKDHYKIDKMKKIIVVVALAIFLTTFSVSATELEVYPETVEIDLIGGDFVQVNITISWSGRYSASCELTTHIEPDGEGINVTYSKNNFTMEPSSKNNIVMSINTSISLAPGTYIITTNVNVGMEEPPKEKDKDNGGGRKPHWYPGYISLEPKDEETDEEEPEDEEEFNDTIYYKADVKYIPFPFWILGIVLFVIMLLYLISKINKKKKMAEEPGNEKK